MYTLLFPVFHTLIAILTIVGTSRIVWKMIKLNPSDPILKQQVSLLILINGAVFLYHAGVAYAPKFSESSIAEVTLYMTAFGVIMFNHTQLRHLDGITKHDQHNPDPFAD